MKNLSYEEFVDKIQKSFKDKKFTMTAQREIILRTIYDSEDHPDIDEIYLRSRKVDAKIGVNSTL